jgi:hypothetical protein
MVFLRFIWHDFELMRQIYYNAYKLSIHLYKYFIIF